MSKEPVRSRTIALIHALQDSKLEESKELSMPDASYGLEGGNRTKSFEKSGEKQIQVNIPCSFTGPIVDPKIERTGENQICYNMPETSSFQ